MFLTQQLQDVILGVVKDKEEEATEAFLPALFDLFNFFYLLALGVIKKAELD